MSVLNKIDEYDRDEGRETGFLALYSFFIEMGKT